ncbi:MAG TPA: MATE family efflux transporter [Gaiellales bacterium]|nr:MATE family efflux transporter [Gaiellales bacterium]
MHDRTPTDREVVLLALPALGALIAEPLYVLGDTAIIGHLGTLQLAGLALGGLLLSELFGFCTFLEYGTTARAVRLYGAGRQREALDVGVQATWLALVLGLVAVAGVELAAGPAVRLLGGGATPAAAEGVRWIRVAALGAPFVLAAAAGQGWLRAVQDTRTPLLVIAAANLFSIGVSALLVLGLGVGIVGSAIANVAAQLLSGGVLVALLARRGVPLRPSWRRMRGQLGAARDLSLRTLAFFAAFTVATGVAARIGDVTLAAQQVGVQLWTFAALLLDSTAIAAQALIGRLLGAGSLAGASALARRLLVAGALLGSGIGLLLAAGHAAVPRIFTGDPRVLAEVGVLWPWLVAMMPAAGVLFALDGVFFGAGDLRFMRDVSVLAAVAGFIPLTVATRIEGWGLNGLWLGLSAFLWIRLAVGAARWRGGRWLVAGVRTVDEADRPGGRSDRLDLLHVPDDPGAF